MTALRHLFVNCLAYGLAGLLLVKGRIHAMFRSTESYLAEAQRMGGCEVNFPGTENCLIIQHEACGYYLKYHRVLRGRVEDSWLSLADRTKLNVTVGDDTTWIASVGLFLPRELALIGVQEFRKTGRRSEQIEWIKPDDIPENGNW